MFYLFFSFHLSIIVSATLSVSMISCHFSVSDVINRLVIGEDDNLTYLQTKNKVKNKERNHLNEGT